MLTCNCGSDAFLGYRYCNLFQLCKSFQLELASEIHSPRAKLLYSHLIDKQHYNRYRLHVTMKYLHCACNSILLK